MKFEHTHIKDSDTMLVISVSTFIGAGIGYFFFGDVQYASVLGGGIGLLVGVFAKLGLFDIIDNIIGVFD